MLGAGIGVGADSVLLSAGGFAAVVEDDSGWVTVEEQPAKPRTAQRTTTGQKAMFRQLITLISTFNGAIAACLDNYDVLTPISILQVLEVYQLRICPLATFSKL